MCQLVLASVLLALATGQDGGAASHTEQRIADLQTTV